MKTLIEAITDDPMLQTLICSACEENDVAVSIAQEIADADILILRVDEFYNRHVHNPPPSPDCLIIQHCGEQAYDVYLVELKNIKDLKNFSAKEIRAKFQTCLDDFMSNRFRSHFYELAYQFQKIVLVFVADPLIRNRQKKMKGHLLDVFLGLPPCHFANKKFTIQHEIPNPMIQKCLP